MDSQHARTFTTGMNDTAFKLLKRFQIRVYLQTCRLQIWWTGNFANLLLFPHCCIYLFWSVLCIAQKIKVSKCIECIYCYRYPFLSLKNCLWIRMSAFGRRRGGFLQSLTILNLFLPPIHSDTKKEHAQWYFETFCATWWNFLERELSGGWITAQLDHHLRHFLSA